jgi:hypothetical protein
VRQPVRASEDAPPSLRPTTVASVLDFCHSRLLFNPSSNLMVPLTLESEKRTFVRSLNHDKMYGGLAMELIVLCRFFVQAHEQSLNRPRDAPAYVCPAKSPQMGLKSAIFPGSNPQYRTGLSRVTYVTSRVPSQSVTRCDKIFRSRIESLTRSTLRSTIDLRPFSDEDKSLLTNSTRKRG